MIPSMRMHTFHLENEIKRLKYDVLKKHIEDADKSIVGKKRPHTAIGGTRRKRKISRKRKYYV
jgi:hypothetical protein